MWYGQHVKKVNKAIADQVEVVLLGDSILANLARYPAVWDRHLAPLNAANCGIRGDRTQNVLWRVEHMHLPSTVSVGLIHCGINDINGPFACAYGPHDIAKNVISCGSKLQERNPLMSIVIMGILPAEEAFRGRKLQIDEVNDLLRLSCLSRGFLFVEPSSCWRADSGELNQSLYWRDGLHLGLKGCHQLAHIYHKSIIECRKMHKMNKKPFKSSPTNATTSTLSHPYPDSIPYVHTPPPPSPPRYPPPNRNTMNDNQSRRKTKRKARTETMPKRL